MVGVPLAVDVRPGAIAGLPRLLADRRISSGGQVAVVVGPGQGDQIASGLADVLEQGTFIHTEGGTLQAAQDVATALRAGFYDAVVGIGGGRLLDTTKWAATHTGLAMVAVATNLAHDGIASPVASLEHGGRKASFGVQMPLAVVVDLDFVLASPVQMRRSGIGDVVSNMSAIADWELAASERGEQIDGISVALARTAALSLLHRDGSVDDVGFLTSLAEGLILSGLAMAVAGTSRPCSGGEHEILHAVDHLFPGTSNHGELAGVGALFTSFLRQDQALAADISNCLARHGLPRAPQELGLTDEQFVDAVVRAPATRPDRYTILEHLGLTARQTRERVSAYLDWLPSN